MVLKALILVGGYGTRLRPLTFSKPKPLVEFVNKPVVVYQVEALVQAGVREIIFAVCVNPKALENELKHVAAKLGIQIHFTIERVPLGTAGPIKLNEKLLDPSDPDPFFMLNADVVADFQFTELLKFHALHGKEGSMTGTQVDDPSRFGVVVSKADGQVTQFVEKPKDSRFGKSINAGLYLFNKSVIQRVPANQETSIERAVFPVMAEEGELFMQHLSGYWMDVGKPGDFIIGQNLYLNAIARNADERIQKASSENIIGNVVVGHNANVSPSAVIGPNVVIGPNCVIGNHVRIKNACIFAGARISDAAYVSDSIVGWRSNIGKWARLTNRCILGEDVTVKPEVALVSVIVCPHKSCANDNCDPLAQKTVL